MSRATDRILCHAQLWSKATIEAIKFLDPRANFANFTFRALNFVEQAKFDTS